jgi:hypothetical protein
MFSVQEFAGWKPALPVFLKACKSSIVALSNFHDPTAAAPIIGAEFPIVIPGNFPRGHQR